MNCTFFGHRDAPSNIKPNLERAILSLSDKGVKHFPRLFVGKPVFVI